MPDDPLTKSVEDWTQLDLEQLLGAAESEYLKLKGDEVDINLPSGRSLLARAVAGLMSAAGGYLIVGATSGIDTVEGYPGIDANTDEIDALVRSLQDRVRPHALFRGPLTFEGKDDEKVVLVFQVFRHPAGLPIAADGVFWIRTGSETRRMDYSEVRRWFGQVSDFTSDAVEQADRAANMAAEPFRNEYQRTAGQRGHPELQIEPLTVACIPIAAPRDLGMSGTEPLAVFRESVDRIAGAFVAHLDDHFQSVRTAVSAAGLERDLDLSADLHSDVPVARERAKVASFVALAICAVIAAVVIIAASAQPEKDDDDDKDSRAAVVYVLEEGYAGL